jgi:hypothetical protein
LPVFFGSNPFTGSALAYTAYDKALSSRLSD